MPGRPSKWDPKIKAGEGLRQASLKSISDFANWDNAAKAAYLEPVSLRQVWPDEARDFTPWLADNLHLLGAELNLALELVEVEATLPEAGRVDIIAQQVSTMAKVVIENQLEVSDDSHCLRLLGYAANADANILVWVARSTNAWEQKPKSKRR